MPPNETFIVVWTENGVQLSKPFASQNDALSWTKELFEKHGCDFDVQIHLNRISPPPSILVQLDHFAEMVPGRFPQ
jgi:hypothetical protein